MCIELYEIGSNIGRRPRLIRQQDQYNKWRTHYSSNGVCVCVCVYYENLHSKIECNLIAKIVTMFEYDQIVKRFPYLMINI